jgi:hypothetical protein
MVSGGHDESLRSTWILASLKTMWRVLVMLASMSAVYCQLATFGAANELLEHAKAQAAEDARNCDSKYPRGDRGAAVERAKCQNAALENFQIVMSSAQWALLERFSKVRLYVAKEVEAGNMDFEQANRIIAETRNELLAAEKRTKEKQTKSSRPAPPPQQSPIIVQQPVIVQQPAIVDPGPTLCIKTGPGMTICD